MAPSDVVVALTSLQRRESNNHDAARHGAAPRLSSLAPLVTGTTRQRLTYSRSSAQRDSGSHEVRVAYHASDGQVRNWLV